MCRKEPEMRSRMLAIPAMALLMACGAPPSRAISRLTNDGAIAALNSVPSRLSGHPNGTGWTINSPIPEPLGVAQGATVASADGSRLYHIGGITGDLAPSNRAWMYSIADDAWMQKAGIPVSPGIRTFGAALERNGFIYVFGGYDGTNIFDTTWIYDETKDSWFRGANMPGPRFGSGVAADGDVIYLEGGVQALPIGGEGSTGWRYEPDTDVWFELGGTPIPTGRIRAVAMPNGDIHVLGGGFDGNINCVYNFRVPNYFCPPSIPFGVTDAAVASDGRYIYVVAAGGPALRAPLAMQAFDTVTGRWLTGPPMPEPLVDNSSGAVANGVLYVLGGYDGANPVSVNYSLPLPGLGLKEMVSPAALSPSLELIDRRELSRDRRGKGSSPWSLHWPVPEGYGVSQGSTLASSDGSLIYHIGGLTGLGTSNRVRVYSAADDADDASSMRSPWWDVAPVPLERGIRTYGSAVELNGFIYLFGGLSGNLPREEVLNTTWIYDEAKNSWRRGADLPGYRFGSAVATDGAIIWVIGGYNQFQGADHNVWRYDPKADSYSIQFRDIPRDLGRIHGAWLPDGTVHVFGGNGPGTFDNHLVYDTIADAWSSLPPVPLAVLDPATVTDGTLIYLVGGNYDHPREPAHTQIFDPATGTWSEGPPLPPWPLVGDVGIDNTSGTIANGVFYVMGGSIGGATGSFNYSIPLAELSAFNR